MLTDEIREFLKKPLIARLSVIDSRGYPHTVPLWFDMDGDDIVIISDRNTRKNDYIKVDPKGAINIGGDANDGAGYLFKGEFSLEEDPGYKWLSQMTYRYEPKEKAEKDIELWRTTLDMMVIRFKIRRVAKVI
jgi:general stress protein 26